MRRALDLFCGAGGITKGLQNAGFHVTGIDIKAQPNYCGDLFIQQDAIDFLMIERQLADTFDFIHASPPCQGNTTLRNLPGAKQHVDLIPAVRARLKEIGLPYSIENVPGADMDIGGPTLLDPGAGSGVMLCGSMFALADDEYELRRHRLFETSVPIRQPFCKHGNKTVVGFYGDHVRIRQRAAGTHKGTSITGPDKLRLAEKLMGIDWMTQKEIDQAIPPAYSQYVVTEIINQSNVGAWRPCFFCDDYFCRIHNQHTADCSCPPVEDWQSDPYTTGWVI